MRLFAMCCAGLMASTPVFAQDRETLGVGRLFNNDYFGDGEDRWRSGSYALSIVRGEEWSSATPTAFGSLLEYRLRSEIIAPEALNGAGSDDRAYVGSISAGVHTHFTQSDWDVSLGADLVFVGPQTGVLDFQDSVHDFINAPSVSAGVDEGQLKNAVYPTLVAQAMRPITLNENTRILPFVEAQIGVENFLRVGADVTIGPVLGDDLWLRDSTTGHLYSGITSEAVGTGFVLGADYAFVGDSAYFPASFGTDAEDTRFRARAGVHSRNANGFSVFYGLTYLSEEYIGQTQGQVVGSLNLNFSF